MKILLINPKYPESFWSFRWAVNDVLPQKRAVNPPLGLATLAALTPGDWEVRIVDENVESIPLETDADIVGVCGMGVQFERQRELLAYYRGKGCYTVAGGSFASLCPERYEGLVDTVVAGEAEYIWKRFCADFELGKAQSLYRESGTVRLEDSPTPRFDLLALERYTTATLQFSRGCPYLCEFCDIIVMFGRKPRHKNVAQVERELDALRARGVHNVFFVDDNLIGHRAVAKELLRALARYQQQHGYPFSFGTEVSINLAQDKELLELFREARFSWVFVGIESPDPETLKQTRKMQNTHEDVLTSVRRMYEYGIDVLAGFIVGFDKDTPATFGQQYQFIVDSGIQAAMVGLLTALPKTPLYERLAAEGRLREGAGTDNTKAGTNLEPKNMSYDELIDGYQDMYRRLTSDASIAQRIRNKLRYMRFPVYQGEYGPWQQIVVVARLLTGGIARGGVLRGWHFLRSLPLLRPRTLPVAIVDWIAGLSMQDYVRRHFPGNGDTRLRARKLTAHVMRAARTYVQDVKSSVSVTMAEVPKIAIRVDVPGGMEFVRRVRRPLLRLLKHTQARITLRIDSITIPDAERLRHLLQGLARFGDRVSLVLGERARVVLAADSSVFNVVLSRPDSVPA